MISSQNKVRKYRTKGHEQVWKVNFPQVQTYNVTHCDLLPKSLNWDRGVINGKAGIPKFSDTLTLSQPGEADYAHSLALPHLKFFLDYIPVRSNGGPMWTCYSQYLMVENTKAM